MLDLNRPGPQSKSKKKEIHYLNIQIIFRFRDHYLELMSNTATSFELHSLIYLLHEDKTSCLKWLSY